MLSFLKMMGPSLGIHLQPTKVKVLLSKQDDIELALSIKFRLTAPSGSHGLNPDNILIHPDNDTSIPLSEYGAILLGSPVGTDDYCIGFCTDLITKLEDEATKIKDLPDTQSAFLLLKYCFSQKIQHLLRTVPPHITRPHLLKPFNNIIRSILTSLLKLNHLTHTQFKQTKLDISDGGLGIGLSLVTPQASFAASFIESFTSIEENIPSIRLAITNSDLSPHISSYVQSVNYLDYKSFNPITILQLQEIKSERLQKLFSATFKTNLTKLFMESIAHLPEDTARVSSCASSDSSSFLLAIPKTPKLTASPLTFSTMILRRLGCDLPQLRPMSCICSGHPRIDPRGVHLIACKHGPERTQTHDFMLQDINSCVKACGLYSKTERSNFFRSVSTDNGKRPDIEIRGLDRGYLGDVMVTDPISSQLTINNAKVIGRAALHAERIKNMKFSEDSSAANMLFLPFVFETYGRWGPAFERFFTTLMTHGSCHTGIDYGTLTNYWRRRLSFTLQKAIAAGILSRMGKLNSSPHHDESNWMAAVVDQSIVRY